VSRSDRPALSRTLLVAALVLGTLTAAAVGVVAQTRREFAVTARRYTYDVSPRAEPATMRVRVGDLVRVTFSAADIAHSFTIDEYRINKRAEPGKPVTFEFRADRPGTFVIYCNLTLDERCLEETRGQLIVLPAD